MPEAESRVGKLHESTSAGRVDRIVRVLRHYGQRAGTVASWAHPSWIAPAIGVDEPTAVEVQRLLPPDSPASHAISGALLRHWKICPPPLAAIGRSSMTSAATRSLMLDVIPSPVALRMLRLRALAGQAGQLRRMVDRPARQRVADATGVAFTELLASLASPTRAPMMPMTTFDDASLASAGYNALAHGGARAGALCALGLPRPIVEAAGRSPARLAESSLNDEWSRMLPRLFPEWEWLFG